MMGCIKCSKRLLLPVAQTDRALEMVLRMMGCIKCSKRLLLPVAQTDRQLWNGDEDDEMHQMQ
jgi:DNA-directed RNA polymerase subunit RPC12/RpoP